MRKILELRKAARSGCQKYQFYLIALRKNPAQFGIGRLNILLSRFWNFLCLETFKYISNMWNSVPFP